MEPVYCHLLQGTYSLLCGIQLFGTFLSCVLSCTGWNTLKLFWLLHTTWDFPCLCTLQQVNCPQEGVWELGLQLLGSQRDSGPSWSPCVFSTWSGSCSAPLGTLAIPLALRMVIPTPDDFYAVPLKQFVHFLFKLISSIALDNLSDSISAKTLSRVPVTQALVFLESCRSITNRESVSMIDKLYRCCFPLQRTASPCILMKYICQRSLTSLDMAV